LRKKKLRQKSKSQHYLEQDVKSVRAANLVKIFCALISVFVNISWIIVNTVCNNILTKAVSKVKIYSKEI